MSASWSLDAFLLGSAERVERYLDKALPPASEPPVSLHEAMRYAVLSGGKRLRPALTFGAAEALGGDPERVLPVAAAAELVHAYSLVHDDLPAMDDDQERRGRPTVHVRYGEATAILVGDALLAEAFAQLATPDAAPELIARLAQTAGSRALVGGQADDLAFAAGRDSLERILSIHQRKTAALFQYAGWGGARSLGATAVQEKALEHFGRHYGLAYQLLDDLRDADPKECSILRVLAEHEVRARAEAELAAALEALAPCAERAVALRGLAGRLLGWLT